MGFKIGFVQFSMIFLWKTNSKDSHISRISHTHSCIAPLFQSPNRQNRRNLTNNYFYAVNQLHSYAWLTWIRVQFFFLIHEERHSRCIIMSYYKQYGVSTQYIYVYFILIFLCRVVCSQTLVVRYFVARKVFELIK